MVEQQVVPREEERSGGRGISRSRSQSLGAVACVPAVASVPGSPVPYRAVLANYTPLC